MIVLAYFGMCNTKHKKHWHHVDKTKYVGNKWLKAHEREREGEKKYIATALVFHVGVPKGKEREGKPSRYPVTVRIPKTTPHTGTYKRTWSPGGE